MRVAIFGCGYVGLRVGHLLTERGHDVIGIRRSRTGCAEIEAAGFRPVRGDVGDPHTVDNIPEVDAIIYAVSPDKGDPESHRVVYEKGLRLVQDRLQSRTNPPERLLFTSSTGVYGDHDGEWVDENTTPNPAYERAQRIVDAEEIVRTGPFDSTIVRFAGLYGPGRYRLNRYLRGPVTEGILNMIHRNDAAGVLEYLLEDGIGRDQTIIAVDNEPVSKWKFADWLAYQCGMNAPEKITVFERISDNNLSQTAIERIRANKRCSNEKLRGLGYEFEYPTFRSGYRDAIEDFRGDMYPNDEGK